MYNVRNKQISYKDLVLHCNSNDQGSSDSGLAFKICPGHVLLYVTHELRMSELVDVLEDDKVSWFVLRKARSMSRFCFTA
jgi:hypothetical protein